MPSTLDKRLADIVKKFSADVGIIHRLDAAKNQLDLVAFTEGFPDELLMHTRCVPVGKGIAGTVAATRKPIIISDLPVDQEPAIRPLARKIGIRGMMAIPLFHKNELIGTLGVGYEANRKFSQEEVDSFLQAGDQLAAELFEEHLA